MKEQHLTLVGLTEDKTKLVLVGDTGEEFTLEVDDKLRAALRGDHARLGQLEITMESALRPRDIQARIRAGETPESVAAAAQTTIDKVMGYATPVLAERAHIAERAQRASVRRRAGEGPARSLGDAVDEQLRSHNIDPGTVDWDAWRREDGRWALVAEYKSGEGARRASFLFDAPGRYVMAEDDEARRLLGELATERPQRTQPARPGPGRRLTAVPADDELPLGEDAIELVSDEESTVDLTAPAGQVRGTGTPAPEGGATGGATGDADWIATQASDRAPAPEPSPVSDAVGDAGSDAGGEAGATEADEPARRGGRKGRRASVPSWDEIMFGGGRQE
jgi:hypothetical protein